jgi:hypothetical protein
MTGPTGYFLIIDRLFETLDARIQRWAKPSATKKSRRFSKLRRSISLGGSLTVAMGKSSKDLSKSSSLPSSTSEDEVTDERLSVGEYICDSWI